MTGLPVGIWLTLIEANKMPLVELEDLAAALRKRGVTRVKVKGRPDWRLLVVLDSYVNKKGLQAFVIPASRLFRMFLLWMVGTLAGVIILNILPGVDSSTLWTTCGLNVALLLIMLGTILIAMRRQCTAARLIDERYENWEH